MDSEKNIVKCDLHQILSKTFLVKQTPMWYCEHQNATKYVVNFS